VKMSQQNVNWPNTGIRVDRERRVREEAAFLGPKGAAIFAAAHLPIVGSDIRGGILICSPIGLEMMKNYRREVVLGRELAGRGFAVQRFHYRGMGHSDGFGNTTFESMIQDATTALSALHVRIGSVPMGFLGTRIGGLVAAQMAGRRPGAPLALWQPVIDPSRHLREVLRARKIVKVRQHSAEPEEPEVDLSAFIETSQAIDVLGYRIDAALYESLDLRFPELMGSAPRPILLVDVDHRGHLRADCQDLKHDLEESGFPVETEVIRQRDVGWWFLDLQRRGDVDQPIMALTTEWFERTLG
jgi:alpha/beta superfamily hydrolase